MCLVDYRCFICRWCNDKKNSNGKYVYEQKMEQRLCDSGISRNSAGLTASVQFLTS